MRTTEVGQHRVYVELRTGIVEGSFPPGTPLREISLAERFGTSRTPVREAFGRLEQEGLIARVGRGFQVRRLETDDVIQIYALRRILESEAAAQAALSRSPSDLAQLRGLLDRDRARPDMSDQNRRQSNLVFHARVWAATRNRMLIDLLERLTAHVPQTLQSTLSVPGRWDEALDEHEQMIDAIERRDAEAARAIGERHMETALALRLELLRSEADSFA